MSATANFTALCGHRAGRGPFYSTADIETLTDKLASELNDDQAGYDSPQERHNWAIWNFAGALDDRLAALEKRTPGRRFSAEDITALADELADELCTERPGYDSPEEKRNWAIWDFAGALEERLEQGASR